MLKKSILILVEADNTEFSKKALSLIEKTWAKEVLAGAYPNISVYAYCAMTESMLNRSMHKNLGIIDNRSNTVYVPAEDRIYGSFKKIYLTLKTLEPVIKRNRFDYIFKTDLSTFVNVPLLDKFVQEYIQDGEEVIYTGRIKSSRYAIGPQQFCLYADRSSILLPVRPYYNVLTQAKYRNSAIQNDKVIAPEYWEEIRMNVDENAMGFIIDNYLIEYGKSQSEFYRDWNMRTFDNMDEDMWHKQIVMNVRHCSCKDCELDDMQYIYDVVSDYYFDGNQADLSYILNYLYSSRCPKIYCVDEKSDSENYTVLNLAQWKEVFSVKSLETVIPDKSENNSSSNNSNSGGASQCYHYSYLDYFNLPHHHYNNCPYNQGDSNYSHGNSSSTGSNSSASNSSNSNDDFGDENLNENKGCHVNTGRPCHCCNEDKVWPDPDDFGDEDEKKGCHKHHKCEHKDDNWYHKHRLSCKEDCDCNKEEDKQPEKPAEKPEDKPSCDCNNDDIWCNSNCHGHDWWHNEDGKCECPDSCEPEKPEEEPKEEPEKPEDKPEKPEKPQRPQRPQRPDHNRKPRPGGECDCNCPCNPSTGDTEKPEDKPGEKPEEKPDVSETPETPDSSKDVSCDMCPDHDCECPAIDTGEIGKELKDIKDMLDSLSPKEDETPKEGCDDFCSCQPADQDAVADELSKIEDLLNS